MVLNDFLWSKPTTNQNHIALLIQRRKWVRIRRTEKNRRHNKGIIQKEALDWNSQGARRQGRPRKTRKSLLLVSMQLNRLINLKGRQLKIVGSFSYLGSVVTRNERKKIRIK